MANRDAQIVCLEINDAYIRAGLLSNHARRSHHIWEQGWRSLGNLHLSSTCEFPAVVGRLSEIQALPGLTLPLSSAQRLLVGDQCQASGIRHLLEINHPVYMGIVRSWEDMFHLFDYTFQRLGIDPRADDYRISLSYSLSSYEDLPKIVQTMFERYAFSSVQFVHDAIASLYYTGLLTGLVVDVGKSFTHITPVCDGQTLPDFVKCINLAGRNVTECV